MIYVQILYEIVIISKIKINTKIKIIYLYYIFNQF